MRMAGTLVRLRSFNAAFGDHVCSSHDTGDVRGSVSRDIKGERCRGGEPNWDGKRAEQEVEGATLWLWWGRSKLP